jgi:hypothetical protein
VVATPRFAGTGALQADAATRGQRARLVHALTVQTSGVVYLRAWLYVPPSVTIGEIDALSLGDVDGGDWGTRLVLAGDELGASIPTGALTSLHLVVPKGQWFCVRLEVTLDATNGCVHVYLNDTEAVYAQNVHTLPANGVLNVSAGIEQSVQDGTAQLLVDQLVVDTQPVACTD